MKGIIKAWSSSSDVAWIGVYIPKKKIQFAIGFEPSLGEEDDWQVEMRKKLHEPGEICHIGKEIDVPEEIVEAALRLYQAQKQLESFRDLFEHLIGLEDIDYESVGEFFQS